MTTTLLFLHIALAGLWLGCVLTEVLFERALLGQGPDAERILARLHRRVDLAIELPAFLGVLATGAALLAGRSIGPGLAVKIALGLVAILANGWCVRLVLQRADAVEAGDQAAFARIDRRQHAAGTVVLLGLAGALVLGLALPN